MENYCLRKEKPKKSINDDFESLFGDLRHGKKPDGKVRTYFLPKLTKQELKLVDRKESNFMNTFGSGNNADVDKAEMKLSESSSKFVRNECVRRTVSIKNPFYIANSCSSQ